MLCAIVSLSGCASIVSKSTWPVTINSTPVGAKVTIYNNAGMPVQTGETPFTVSLDSSRGYFQPARYRVELTKPGHAPQTGTFSAHMNPWYAGNLVFGGLIGILIVDPATGAMWKLPNNYMGVLPRKVATVQKPGHVTITSINDIPASMRGKLTRIN